jgi:hypothetical protein
VAFRRFPKRRTVQLGDVTITVKSGLEETLALQQYNAGVPVRYEDEVILYDVPGRPAKYNPDFTLPSGVIVEGKGVFDAADRQKHLLIKAQHPEREVRFVFSNPNGRIAPGAKMTLAEWCDKHGYKYAAKVIPTAWLKEKKK